MKMDSSLIFNPIEVLDNINDGFFVLDKDKKVIYFNKSSERLLGRKYSEVINKPFPGLFVLVRRLWYNMIRLATTNACLSANRAII